MDNISLQSNVQKHAITSTYPWYALLKIDMVTNNAKRIITTGGTNVIKYYTTIIGPSVVGKTYETIFHAKNNGTTTVYFHDNLGAAVSLASGAEADIYLNGNGDGTSYYQLVLRTAVAGDNIDVTMHPGLIGREVGTTANLVGTNSNYVTNWTAYSGASAVVTTVTAPRVSLRLAANPEDVTFKGEVYSAFAMEAGPVDQKGSAQLPELQIQVSNIDKVVEGYCNANGGLVGATVHLMAVSAADLNNDPAQDLIFLITSSYSDAEWVHFTLSSLNPNLQKFCRFNYYKDTCINIFNSPTLRANLDPRGAYCNYTGTDTSCDHTLAACTAKGNVKNFLAFPGIDSIGFKAASPV